MRGLPSKDKVIKWVSTSVVSLITVALFAAVGGVYYILPDTNPIDRTASAVLAVGILVVVLGFIYLGIRLAIDKVAEYIRRKWSDL